MEHPPTDTRTKPVRPLGVWILTIYAALFAGLVPLAAAVALFLLGSMAGAPGSSIASLLLTLVLCTGIVAAAIGTWQGHNRSRQALLILITAYYVLVAVNNAFLLSDQGASQSAQLRMIGRMARGILFPAVYIWYFRRRSTLKYYE
jgi:hypothetical protein